MKAFTLIEIIVVVAIIAVLLGISLTVFSQARTDSQTTVCANNLRNIGYSLRLYVDDYDGNWPDTEVWHIWRKVAMSKLDVCPLVAHNPAMNWVDNLDSKNRVIGYAYNEELGWAHHNTSSDGTDSIVGVHDREILFPATTVSICEARPDKDMTQAPDPDKYVSPYPYGVEQGWKRHNGQGNYLFCDGHIKAYHGEQVLPAVPPINDGTQPAFALSTIAINR